MKKLLFLICIFFTMIFSQVRAATTYNYSVLVLPVDIFNVCENTYCFPEVSNIIAQDVISNLNQKNGISAKNLYDVRKKLYSNDNLKTLAEGLLNQYKMTDRVNFDKIDKLSKEFEVKSVLLIDAYSNNDKTPRLKRNLWENLEINNAFEISYPYYLVVNAVLTDSINNVIMWSSKFSKIVSDSNGFFKAQNMTQAHSQLEKIKLYSQDNISKNISQNIYLRFFPKDSLSADINISKDSQENSPRFMPNALDNLSPTSILKELEKEKNNSYDNVNDFIFQF